jgi:hypothetical protein
MVLLKKMFKRLSVENVLSGVKEVIGNVANNCKSIRWNFVDFLVNLNLFFLNKYNILYANIFYPIRINKYPISIIKNYMLYKNCVFKIELNNILF